MKLIHALWGDAPAVDPSPLLDPALHARLAAVGVRRVQVNLDDIADSALRLSTAEPIRAVVSSWTDGPPQQVGAALAPLADRVAGWQVQERVPTEPPVVPHGERADALANIAFLRRPADLEPEAWLAHWHGPHTEIAIETQATFGYVQNLVIAALDDGAPPVDGIVEELFASAAISDIHAFYGSGGDDAELNRRITRLMASVSVLGADRDLDLVPTSRYVFDLTLETRS